MKYLKTYKIFESITKDDETIIKDIFLSICEKYNMISFNDFYNGDATELDNYRFYYKLDLILKGKIFNKELTKDKSINLVIFYPDDNMDEDKYPDFQDDVNDLKDMIKNHGYKIIDKSDDHETRLIIHK